MKAFIAVMERTIPSSQYKYYHVCSDGYYTSVLFIDEIDFMAAMNRTAVCAFLFGVIVIAFVLMDNHFHFIIKCRSKAECIRFINEFKRITGVHNATRHGEKGSLVRLPVKVIDIVDEVQLKTDICYVLKNPTKARIGMFYHYPWGTGNLYFRQAAPGGDVRTIGDYTVDEIRKMCRTRVALPKEWLVKDGIILPENYVAVDEVERLFRTTRSMMYFLSLNQDEQIEKDLGEWNAIRLTDAELRKARREMSRMMFAKDRLCDLSAPERMKLARKLHDKYLSSKKQLARILQLPLEVVGREL